jgi:tRNA A-37 threonylcarbamoyl transferase component Bud32
MSGVFISYAREDRATAQRLAREFEKRGWTVWWDFRLVPGDPFRVRIREALNEADCVVVLWSPHSVDSNFVIDEADVGRQRQILVPAMIDREVELPFGFGGFHAADLTGWRRGGRHAGLAALIGAVAAHLGGAAVAEPLTPEPKERVRRGDRAEVVASAATGVEPLVDRYELGERLGQGQLTEVFEGYDRLLGRTVAIRLPPAYQHVRDAATVERMQTEARLLARLIHPNVVAVYDVGVDHGRFFVVMEHVRGPALRALLDREGALAPARSARIATGVCAALAAAHRAGIVHGDLRPESILVTGDNVKVTNFGVAPVTGDVPDVTTTETGAVRGDPRYLAPEMVQYGRLDARSDFYTLGCCLYEMLTGEPPFDGPTPVAVAYRHISDDPQPPSRQHPDVPPALDAAVLRALAKDPGSRFRSAEDMGAAIQLAASG